MKSHIRIETDFINNFGQHEYERARRRFFLDGRHLAVICILMTRNPCFLSQGTIAKMTGFSRKTVNNLLQDLEVAGLNVDRVNGETNDYDVYTLFEEIAKKSGYKYDVRLYRTNSEYIKMKNREWKTYEEIMEEKHKEFEREINSGEGIANLNNLEWDDDDMEKDWQDGDIKGCERREFSGSNWAFS